ncbi:Mob1/phocein [Phyllosticta citribraziliensis]|uniref:Mob1/phocein n=1 Tax=Phyllosticta citribraziliensis TaxID=989973 RepID=A0ABR1LGZ1_9PEZI
MTSFITTMYAEICPPSPSHSSRTTSPSFPSTPRPLSPVFTFPNPAPIPCLPHDLCSQDADPCDCLAPQHYVPVRRDAGSWDDAYWHRAHLGFTPPALPGGAYTSPLQREFDQALRSSVHTLLAPSQAGMGYDGHHHIPEYPDPPKSHAAWARRPPAPAAPARYQQNMPNQPPPQQKFRMSRYKGKQRANGRHDDSSNSKVARAGNGGTAAFRAKEGKRGTSSWQLKQFAEATLGSGSLRKAVQLPEGEDIGEWLAVNVVDFYNQINLIYGSITEFCSPQSCPEMKATDEFEYLWQDSENYKRPTKMSAPEYIEHLMAWVQANVDNEAMFPPRVGVEFPKQFPSLIRQLFKRLYRVYAHIYCHHYPVIIALGLEPHLNTSFKHYVLFVEEHQLSQGSRDFWGPLGDLVESMLRSD